MQPLVPTASSKTLYFRRYEARLPKPSPHTCRCQLGTINVFFSCLDTRGHTTLSCHGNIFGYVIHIILPICTVYHKILLKNLPILLYAHFTGFLKLSKPVIHSIVISLQLLPGGKQFTKSLLSGTHEGCQVKDLLSNFIRFKFEHSQPSQLWSFSLSPNRFQQTSASSFRIKLLLGCHGLVSDAARFRVRTKHRSAADASCIRYAELPLKMSHIFSLYAKAGAYSILTHLRCQLNCPFFSSVLRGVPCRFC